MRHSSGSTVAGMCVLLLTLVVPRGVLPAAEADPQAPLKAAAGLAVAFAYQTHMNVGLVADAHANKVYDKALCEQLLKGTIALIEPIVTQLEEVLEGELDDADKAYFEKVVELIRLLGDQAESLLEFVQDGDDADRKKYLDLREQTKTQLDAITKSTK